ncbi:12.2K protein [Human adenovirus 54]|uniref:12.2 kDa protein n=2 Tax=Human mastadenovirus D TaxID=130310 RepID=B9A5N4_9ADEN|nr:12.2 kDa protein [Human adenovirus 54]BAC87850.1 E3A1 12.1k [Human adenovirus D8]BAH18898.1 12.2kDa protein [Human adenovirus 54]BAH84805.1 12.2 kDa protein [Human adenovirus 54]BAX64526.1 12.2K protein [Human adenovirus 54]BAX64678.1 12.2K protein [Human adenovirus 54]
MSYGDSAELARLRHLDHCRRLRCFARESCGLVYFKLPEEHPNGPAHGVRITVEGTTKSYLVRFFTQQPFLVERDRGATTYTVYCICPTPKLHENFCCTLCGEFNKS